MTNMKFGWKAKAILMPAVLAFFGTAGAQADALLQTQTNCYAFGANSCAVEIDSSVWQSSTDFDASAAGDFIWKYHVINNSFDPLAGTSNGFSGFELALPGGFPPDLHDVTNPAAGWINNCCSGEPEEWDIKNSASLGIMPGSTGDFSFETAPRVISNATGGWFHTWEANSQTDITLYSTSNTSVGVNFAPLAPNLLLPPTSSVPEPSSLILLASCCIAVGFRFRPRLK